MPDVMTYQSINPFAAATAALQRSEAIALHGQVVSLAGLQLTLEGLAPWLQTGARLRLQPPGRPPVPVEVVGFDAGRATALACGPLDGIAPGTPAVLAPPACLAVDDSWLGRVLDPGGQPMDGLGPLRPGRLLRPLRAPPPPAGLRARLGPRLDLGVRALDAFATCRRGQRLGLFAASGIGKSTLLAMLAAGADCDVVVLALVGERGRELREFIEDDLGPAGLARSVVVCATSDSAAAAAPRRRPCRHGHRRAFRRIRHARCCC